MYVTLEDEERGSMSKLAEIQQALKAPKGQRNSFGNYNYRSCEDILEAVKPHLDTYWQLTLSDEIVEVGGRIYVKATAMLYREGDASGMRSAKYHATAYAREAESKKGMDEAQITGAASSYARKYALSGLFCIDDTKDADATNTHGRAPAKKAAPKEEPGLKEAKQELLAFVEEDRKGIFDGDMGTVDFLKNAIKATFGKASLATVAEVEKLTADYVEGRINKEDGSRMERE